MLQSICRYIQSQDRNGDIMDAYQEMLSGTLPHETLTHICRNILSEWKEDLMYTGMTNREKEYYQFLGI